MEYWMFVLMNFIITIALLVVLVIVCFIAGSPLPLSLITVYVLAIVIPSLAVGVRRLHDTNHSGWWYFISLVPFIGSIVLLIFLIMDSQPGSNEYGPNPKEIVGSSPNVLPPPMV